jgi:segregation and condensation protein A
VESLPAACLLPSTPRVKTHLALALPIRHNTRMDYEVQLETFRGPLDLLLYLVKHNEVDICDIPIARVAEQFLEYLQVIQLIDVEWAGEFLVTAATLMEIKSKMLLPRAEMETPEEDDPRL